jgi:hypothetical protein
MSAKCQKRTLEGYDGGARKRKALVFADQRL